MRLAVRYLLSLVVATAAVAGVLVSLLLAGQGGAAERVLAALAFVAGGLTLYAAARGLVTADRAYRRVAAAAAVAVAAWAAWLAVAV